MSLATTKDVESNKKEIDMDLVLHLALLLFNAQPRIKNPGC
jgi:hypothetical protein